MTLAQKQKCDFCGVVPEKIYDAPTTRGPWAWMCEQCWKRNRRSERLGTGMGQLFINKKGGKKLDG